jgi:uncharacterized membrane protein YuzA (DUF378 family)
MTKDLIIVLLGVWVALEAFLGIPAKWDTIIYAVLGISIVILMLLLRRDFVRYIERLKMRQAEKEEGVFVENPTPAYAPHIAHTAEPVHHAPPPTPPHAEEEGEVPPPPPKPRKPRAPRRRIIDVAEESEA